MRGRVLDATTRKPVAQALVRLAGSGVWPAREQRSNREGRFRFEGIPAGVYEVRGGLDSRVAGPIEGLSLQGDEILELELGLQPGLRLRGQVLDQVDGGPLPGVRVRVTEHALTFRARTTRTDPQGRFRFGGLAPRVHRIWLQADGYVARSSPGVQPEQESLRLTLQPVARVSGRVVDTRGRPVKGARLEIWGTTDAGEPVAISHPSRSSARLGQEATPAAGTPNLHVQAATGELGVTHGAVPPLPDARAPDGESGFRTDARGRFQLPNVPPGTLRVLARHSAYAPEISDSIRALPRAVIGELTLVLKPSGQVEGRVLDAQGQPNSGAVVQLQQRALPDVATARTGEAGEFRFNNVRGPVVVEVLQGGRAPVRRSVEVAVGATSRLEMRLPAVSAPLQGRVLDSQGFPIQRAMVRVRSERGGAEVLAVTLSAADGSFQARGLPKGHAPFRVEASHPAYASGMLSQVRPDSGPCELRLPLGRQLTFQLLDAWTRRAVQGARIELRPRVGVAGGPQSRTSDAQGRVAVAPVGPGGYRLVVRAPGYVRLVQALDLDDPEAEAFDLGELLLAAGGRVRGRVQGRYGTPAVGARVAWGHHPSWTDAALTDEEGTFVLTNVPEGDQLLSARLRSGQLHTLERTVRVIAGQLSDGVRLRFDHALEESRDGSPGTGFEATAREPSRRARSGVAVAVHYQQGAVRLRAVAPGSRAARAGLRVGDVVVSIAGETVYSAGQARAMLRGTAGSAALLRIRRNDVIRRVRVLREKHSPLPP